MACAKVIIKVQAFPLKYAWCPAVSSAERSTRPGGVSQGRSKGSATLLNISYNDLGRKLSLW